MLDGIRGLAVPRAPLLVCLLVLGIVPSADGRTWHVEKDGSGDYTTIQPAVDNASPGDTIRIGVGRWTEYHSVVISGTWSENVYVHVTVNSLTIIGSGQDQTIIGPTAPIHLPSEMPKGIMALDDISRLHVRQLAIENIRDGWYQSQGELATSHCTFRGCYGGLVSWASLGNLVEDCEFLNCSSDGIIAFSPGQGFVIRRCLFSGNDIALDFNTVDATVESCTFRGGWVGAQFVFGASGTVRDCVFEESIFNFSFFLRTSAQVQVINNRVHGGACRLYADSGASVSGSGNSFSGASYTTMLFVGGAASLHGNHIFKGAARTVKVEAYTAPQTVLDLTGNYWGTSISDSIAAWIWDHNDDSSLPATVDFDPFSTTPLPSEQKSLGSVKNLYR